MPRQRRFSADTQSIVEQWESTARPHSQRAPGCSIRTDWSKRAGRILSQYQPPTVRTRRASIRNACRSWRSERDILGVGVETVGTDAGQAHTFNPMFPCHTIMHGANRFGLASLTNLDQLPPTGAVVIAPPLKIVNGSGSPLRVLALVPV